MLREKGFTTALIVVGLLVVLGLVGGAYYLGTNTQKVTAPTVSSKPSVSLPASPSSTISQASNGLKTDTESYGAYEISYPDNWSIVGAYGEGGLTDFLYLGPVKNGSTLITLQQNQNLTNTTKYNFIIPSLGSANNAYFYKDQSSENIEFKMHGLNYILTADLTEAGKLAFPTNQLDSIFQTTAKSLKVLSTSSTCKVPNLVPLTNFPDNFTLSNYHDSDGSDSVNSSWPFPKKTDNYANSSNSTYGTNRQFMVDYAKDGDSFTPDSIFLNLVTPINPVTNNSQNGTDIWHINCINTEDDGPGEKQPFVIDSNINNPFGINLYGSSENPSSLWSVSKWNINLLKQTRAVVYIKKGSLWQKYTAQNYYATMPAAYGGKPAIYLYPKTTSNIQIEVHPQGNLLRTDSLYNPAIFGWNVIADKNGLINKKLNSLYYEAAIPITTPNNGYIVTYDNLFNFSKQYVQELGLNEIESNAFIKFWKQKLPPAPYYMVSNLDQNTINKIYPLKITPEPDTLIRVELYFKPLETRAFLPLPHHLRTPPRAGFTAVEWGGVMDIYR